MKRAIIGTLMAIGALALAPMAFAQSTGPFIVIDQHSIDNVLADDAPASRLYPADPWWYCASDTTQATLGPGRAWTQDDVNDGDVGADAPRPGKRDPLPFFSDLTRVQAACGAGQTDIWMRTGGAGFEDAGWIQLFSIPNCEPGSSPCGTTFQTPDWTQVPPHDFTDGWQNFFTAQEGLGNTGPPCPNSARKPDGSCDPGAEILMDKVPDVHRVGTNDPTSPLAEALTEWAPLFNQLVCSPVHDSDVGLNTDANSPTGLTANFQGNYLGVVAIIPREIRDDPNHIYPLLRITIASPSSCFTALAATFQTLRATRYGKSVVLRWTTASEIETLGFNVYRSYKGKRIKLNARLIPAASLLGGAAPYRYSFRARIASARLAAASRYWIQEVELDRTRNWYGPVRAVSAAARAISLP